MTGPGKNKVLLVVTLVMAAIVLAAGSYGEMSRKPAAPESPGVDQRAATERVYDLPSGRVTVLEVPVNGLKRATERQTCFVWRSNDGVERGFQCPNDRSSYTLDPPTDK